MNNKSERWLDLITEWRCEFYEHDVVGDQNSIYTRMDMISDVAVSSDIIFVIDAGSPSYTFPARYCFNLNQRLISSPSQADMGWAIPASVGVALSEPDKDVVVIVGDGSFMSNMQELAVIKQHNLPIKIIVFNNNGYLSIKNTQNNFYNNRVHGVDDKSGLYFPDLEDIAKSFRFKYLRYNFDDDNFSKLDECINENNEPTIIEMMCLENEEIIPSQNFKIGPDGKKIQAGLDDMYPFLPEQTTEYFNTLNQDYKILDISEKFR
jgi:acetolactate synthase-1/2/3 large subunit